MIEDKASLYGLIGYPVKHSFSPAMHNAAFQALKIDAKYELFEVNPGDLGDFLASLRKKNILGLNVTIPHKEHVVQYLRWKSPEVQFTGAVNVIARDDDNYLRGWNTDGTGFNRHLKYDLNFDPCGKNIVIIGAGGAAKAVANQLAGRGAKAMHIYDIDKDKGSKLADKINNEFPKCRAAFLDAADKLEIRNADLLINATPVGMNSTDPCIINPDLLHPNMLVYDLIYNPSETELLKQAKQRGASISNGLGMLFYQGVGTLEHWLGIPQDKLPLKEMRKALQGELKKRII